MNTISPKTFNAEECLVGRLLVDPTGGSRAFEELESSDLMEPSTALIYDAIFELYSRGDEVDSFSVANHLEEAGSLQEVGGLSELQALAKLGTGLIGTPINLLINLTRYSDGTGVFRRASKE